ncbi:MAG TPA: hypothetical protein VGE57_02660 [Solimonas sp.]
MRVPWPAASTTTCSGASRDAGTARKRERPAPEARAGREGERVDFFWFANDRSYGEESVVKHTASTAASSGGGRISAMLS